jgi:hypothetical protein
MVLLVRQHPLVQKAAGQRAQSREVLVDQVPQVSVMLRMQAATVEMQIIV